MDKPLSTVLCAAGLALLAVATVRIAASVRLAPLFSSEYEAIAQDSLTHPDEDQTFTRGDYQLKITAADGWQTPTVVGELHLGNSELWRQILPHQYGPKFALVTPTGQTLLFDEYINVASDYAIALIDPSGQTTHTYSFSDIHKTIQQVLPSATRADLTRQATTGWWISAPPVLNESGSHARIQTGGTTLLIDLYTGELTPASSS